MDLLGFGNKPKKLEALMAQGAVILDVRTPDEFQRGHAPGSMNVPLNRLGSELANIKAMKKPVITCCASGMRSASAAAMLRREGLECMNGGGWQRFA